MGRVADLAFFSAVLLLCVFSCHAADDVCVAAKTVYRRHQGAEAQVASCSRAQALEDATQELQKQVDFLEEDTSFRLEVNDFLIELLEDDVNALQGGTSSLRRVLTYPNSDPDDVRPFCELYTYSEGMEVARLVFDRENPNVHFVHIPCAPNCPEKFWKIRQGCYRPNDPIAEGDYSPICGCLYDPLPLNETCTRVLHIGPDGYTPNLQEADEPLMMDGTLTDFN